MQYISGTPGKVLNNLIWTHLSAS